MAKKKAIVKRDAWNKGLDQGQRRPFNLSETARIRRLLKQRGDAGLRELALFSTAIDTMLRGQDLLGLTVKDVRKRNRVMRDTVDVTTGKTGQPVRCTLSTTTMGVLEKWIEQSAKKQGEFLFTARGGGGLPMSVRQLNRLIKTWVGGIGLDGSLYGTESLRRTRAAYILNKTGNMEAVRILLGHADIGATAKYLRDAKPVDALAVSRAHEI